MALSKDTIYSTDTSEEIFAPVETGDLTVNQSNITHILTRLTDLYNDPIEAAARETISNALDATMKMPEDQRKPVDVSVGVFDSNFSVRDYGVGMTLEEVKQNFLRYGSSTKGDDFDAVGAYGLGSKAPLAYATEFTVTTTKNGTTTAFKMSNTAAGFKYKVLYTRETHRDSGTVVAIPMRPEDGSRFMRIAEKYQKYAFDFPIVVNSEDSREPEFVELGSITLDEESQTTGRVWMNADVSSRFGRSLPRLDISSVAFVLSGYLYQRPNSYGRTDSVIVELKPGIVDFTSSRDAISETPRTRDFMDKVSEALVDDDFVVAATEEIFKSDLITFDLKYMWFTRSVESSQRDRIKHPDAVTIRDAIDSDVQDSIVFAHNWRHGNVNPTTTFDGTDPAAVGNDPTVTEILANFSKFENNRGFLPVFDRSNSYGDRASYTVIYGVDKDNARKAFGARSKFLRTKVDEDDNFNRSGYFFFRSKKVAPEMAMIEERAGVEYYTVEEFVEVASRANPPKTKSTPSEELDVAKYSVGSQQSRTLISDLSAFAAEKPIIILTSSPNSVSGVHAYLENRETISADTVIYAIDKLNRGVYEELKGSATFYRDGTLTIRSQLVEEEINKSAERIGRENRTIHLRSASESYLLFTMCCNINGFYSDDWDSFKRVMESVLEREVESFAPASFTDHDRYEARHMAIGNIYSYFSERLSDDELERFNAARSSLCELTSAARRNPDSSIDNLVNVAIELPNGLG